MFRTQRTLHRDPRRRQRLDHRGDVLTASLASDHEVALAGWTLEHGKRIGEDRAKVIVEIQRVLPAVLFNDVIGFRAISSDMNTAKQSEDHRQTDNQHTEIKLSVDQEAVLDYLYEHPQESHSTDTLAGSMDDRPRSGEEVIAELRAASEGET